MMPIRFKSVFVTVQSSKTQRVGQISARSTETRKDLTSESDLQNKTWSPQHCEQPLVVGLGIDLIVDTVSVIKPKWQITILKQKKERGKNAFTSEYSQIKIHPHGDL